MCQSKQAADKAGLTRMAHGLQTWGTTQWPLGGRGDGSKGRVLTTGTTHRMNNGGDRQRAWRDDDERRTTTEMSGGWFRRS